MTDTPLDAVQFVRAHTRLAPVAFVPELLLHQADDAFLLWETTERDLARRGVALPFWAFAWPGGVGLARYVLDHPHLVEARRVLDLATGSGLVAIAAARAGATHVIADDFDPLALAAVELNTAANHVEVQPLLADLTAAGAAMPDVDVVLAADIAYERPMAERMFALLRTYVGRGIEVYTADPGRAYLPRDLGDPVATYEVPVSRAIEDADTKPVTVWQLRA